MLTTTARVVTRPKPGGFKPKADEHFLLGGGDGPPYAAAMGMPRPKHWLVTDAVARHRLREPDDAA